MRTSPLRTLLPLALLLALLSFACQLSAAPKPAPTAPPTASETSAPAEAAQAAAATPTILDPAQPTPLSSPEPAVEPPDATPLQALLALRPLELKLEVKRPDGSARELRISLDAAGSAHLVEERAASAAALPGIDFTDDDPAREVIIVDGVASALEGETWVAAPAYVDLVERTLRGADGPFLWLSLLPAEAFQAEGQADAGGFTADHYAVDGTIEGQPVSGEAWFEPGGALVRAELRVAAALLASPDASASGELKIEFSAAKADVAPITAP